MPGVLQVLEFKRMYLFFSCSLAVGQPVTKRTRLDPVLARYGPQPSAKYPGVRGAVLFCDKKRATLKLSSALSI